MKSRGQVSGVAVFGASGSGSETRLRAKSGGERSRHRVLVVDDQTLFRESLCEMLRRDLKGAHIVSAADGAVALRCVEEEQYDLVLTDLKMPGVNGVELLAELHKDDFKGRIIVLSAHLDGHREREARAQGALACLRKPVDLGTLSELCRTTLSELDHGIRGLSITGLAQLFELEGKTGMLRVSAPENQGDLFFVDGRLVNAVVGDQQGDAAAMEIVGWPECELEIHDIALAQPTKISMPLSHLLLEAARSQDEMARAKVSASNDKSTSGLALHPTEDGSHDSVAIGIEAEKPTTTKEKSMANISDSLSSLTDIDGFIGVALVDFKSGMTLGTEGGGSGLNLDVAGAGNTEVVRSKLKVMEQLELDDKIEDILISLGGQYHLIRMLESSSDLFLYLALDRGKANLALARHRLAGAERDLEV